MGLLKDVFSERLNITAFFLVPIGQFVKYRGYSSSYVFVANFLAIIPLASILGQATEALAAHTGQLIGGLLNATFGNAVEMIMCVQAVKAGLVSVVQGNLLGSVLSNLLLVLGMAIFASGIVRKSQEFNAQGAAANMTCQLVASISVCLPTVFGTVVKDASNDDVLLISRICSFFLISVYGMFLVFMLKTHAELFAEEDEHEDDEGQLSILTSTSLLFACTIVVFLCSECLVDSIESVVEDYGLSKAFIGVILLPIVGNAAEHATAVTAAYKGMMDLALGVAVGSSTQIALFVVPCSVMFGWVYDVPMNLNFSKFNTTCQMLTVFLVSQVLQHGKTNWLHGAMLVTVYVFIAVQTLFIPEGQE
jgi:Ca2+:H+ antiporter